MSQSPFLFQAVGNAHKCAHAGQQEAAGGDSATNPVHGPAQLPNTPLQGQRRAQERSADNKPENAEGPFRALVPAVGFVMMPTGNVAYHMARAMKSRSHSFTARNGLPFKSQMLAVPCYPRATPCNDGVRSQSSR